jgi:hypothetical protein
MISILKKKLSTSDYFIIAANILPIIGVWFWGWNPHAIFLVYCLETIIIGIFNLLKMGVVTAIRRTDIWYNQGTQTKQSGIFFMFFFLMHYGIFVGVQMALFMGVSGIGKGKDVNAFNFILKWPSLIDKDTMILLIAFVCSYAVKFFTDFIYTREYRTISLMKLMFQPYGRILVQQFAVIFGSMFLTFGAGKIFILIFAMIKIYFEVFFDFDRILNKGMEEMEKETKDNSQT